MTSFTHIVKRIHEARVFCIGDIMIDRYIYGKVNSIANEAPVPVHIVERTKVMLGGAGNVISNLSALKVQSYFCGVVGQDSDGKLIEKMLKEKLQINNIKLIYDSLRPTTTQTYLMATEKEHQLLRSVIETQEPINDSIQYEIIEFLKENLAHIDVILLSDYEKGVLCASLLSQIINLARTNGIPVLVDPKGIDYSIYSGATLIKPNAQELAAATQLPVSTVDEVINAAKALKIKCSHIEHILVTRDSHGMLLFKTGDEKNHISMSTCAKKVVNVSGAGDTVISVLSACLALKESVETAAFLANVAAGIVVAKPGTAVVTIEEIAMALAELSQANKVMELSDVIEKVNLWRSQKFKIGFTNGCFDLLHLGHLRLLYEAKSKCDCLIVAVNSDSSVERLKGALRPIQNETVRTHVLGGLSMIDAVVVFEEDTPITLIQKLRPDILIKGRDRKSVV